MRPLVSVILPTYNRATTLERSIRSVLDQTFTDFELIVVDDGSTDGTREFLGRYEGVDNVRVVLSGKGGASAARNLGARHARGTYLAFHDSDDAWVPHKLARAVEVLGEAGNEDAVFYSDMLWHRPGRDAFYYCAPAVRPGCFFNERRGEFEVSGISMQTLVVKKEHYDAVGGCDEDMPRYIDLELCIRLADRYRMVRCAESLCDVYLGPGISTNTRALVAARRKLIRKYRDRLKRPRAHLARQYLYLSHAQRLNGETVGSMLTAVRAWTVAPMQFAIMRSAAAEVLRAMKLR